MTSQVPSLRHVTGTVSDGETARDLVQPGQQGAVLAAMQQLFACRPVRHENSVEGM